jgi:hypothetical protein
MSSIDQHRMHPVLSRRDRFELATLLAAGVASTVFILTPVWTAFDPWTSVPTRNAPQLSTTESRAESSTASAIRATETPSAPAPQATPAVQREVRSRLQLASAKRPARTPQSRWSRLLLGDGTPRVQPFPLLLHDEPER